MQKRPQARMRRRSGGADAGRRVRGLRRSYKEKPRRFLWERRQARIRRWSGGGSDAGRRVRGLRRSYRMAGACTGGRSSTMGQRGRMRTAQTSGTDSPAARRKAPAKAIMAPLSVHSAGSG